MEKDMQAMIAVTVIIVVIVVALLVAPLRPSEIVINQTRNSDAFAAGTPYWVISSEPAYYGEIKGYFAHPREAGAYPGVIMIHEWWGLNDNIRDMADTLASEGYNVLAVDLYHGAVAQTQQQARSLVSALNQSEALENMRAAGVYLREHAQSSALASLGWCFGGGQSLQLALSDEELDATVIYYGTLVTNASLLSEVEQPILGIFGSEDTSIPVSTVEAFNATLNSLGIKHEIYIYEGVGHAFANPSGMNYAPSQTRDAWMKTLAFLAAHTKQ